MNFGTPVLMAINNSVSVFLVTSFLSFAIITFVFFGLKYLHKKKHPTEEDIQETNRQRREREKLKRETTEKVNAFMSGKKSDSEYVPNGKRCGKYKKKNKKKK